MPNAYKQHGYENRNEYLLSLADEHGLDAEKVFLVAELLGKSEDFDGLVSALGDAADMGL